MSLKRNLRDKFKELGVSWWLLREIEISWDISWRMLKVNIKEIKLRVKIKTRIFMKQKD